MTQQRYFFTSDLHLSHRNIIKYCKRPFIDENEMNEAIISRWNSIVSPKDIVYVVGDVTFEKDEAKRDQILYQLHCMCPLRRIMAKGNELSCVIMQCVYGTSLTTARGICMDTRMDHCQTTKTCCHVTWA